MDKTMEITLAALVFMLAAVIIISMMSGQVDGFGDSVNDSREDVSGNISNRINDLSNTDYEGLEQHGKISEMSKNGQEEILEA